MVCENDHILPITLWSNGAIRHKISCVAVSADNSTIVTGSWDGNVFIWNCNLEEGTLTTRWMVSGRGSGVTAIACWDTFFFTAHQDGTMCHMELPSGRILHQREDTTLIHNQAVVLSGSEVVCAGFYPDVYIIDPFTLQIILSLQSRVQSDWVTCLRILSREDGIHIQGLTFSGVLKTWALRNAEGGVALESNSGPLNITQCKAMAFDMDRKYLLLVTQSKVIVFDSSIKIIFSYESEAALEGGDFYETRVVIWTKRGDLFECNLDDQSTRELFHAGGFEAHVAGNSLIKTLTGCFHVCADISGRLVLTRLLPDVSVEVVASVDVTNVTASRSGLLDKSSPSVTCSVHVANLNKFIAGCSDGSIRIYSASGLLHSYFFHDEAPDYTVLVGHKKTVRCILYPHFKQQNYSESLIVSGSDDHSVCLWDVCKQQLLHRFSVHSGPVVKLLTPPADCLSRIANTICSVGADHSVAILSLRESRCVFFASQHPFPIVAVHWKPDHDFMLVKCFDGSVFVWELKTGVLDRVLSGVCAEEVVYDCVESNDEALFDFYTRGSIVDDIERKTLDLSCEESWGPVQLRGILSSPGLESHVLVINVSKLAFYLESVFPSEETGEKVDLHDLSRSPTPSGLHKKIVNVFEAIKQEAGNLQEKFHLSVPVSAETTVSPQRKTSAASGTQLIPLAQLTLSLLHSWQLENSWDEICSEKLGLLKPKGPVTFDIPSNNNIVSLSLGHVPYLTKYEEIALSSLVDVLREFSFSEKNCHVDITEWEAMVQFNKALSLPPDAVALEMLAALWRNSSRVVRSSVQNSLPHLMSQLNTKDRLNLLYKWKKFLPTGELFPGNGILNAVAMVLFGILTADVGFKATKMDNVKETAYSIRSVFTSKHSDNYLREVAVDLLGRGFTLWEPFFPVDEALISIFHIFSTTYSCEIIDISRDTLRLIAKHSLNQFLAFLKLMCKTGHPLLEKSKSEIIGVVRDIVSELPEGLECLLSDAVEVLLACIDPAHLRSRELFALIPGIRSFDQLHHSLTANRIAIGMPDGKVVVNDLKTHRTHVFPAHDDSVAAVRFSNDGKILLTLSTLGTASLWQPSHGYFDIGLGQFRFRCLKTQIEAVPQTVVSEGVKVVWDDGNRCVSIYHVDSVDANSPLVTLTL